MARSCSDLRVLPHVGASVQAFRGEPGIVETCLERTIPCLMAHQPITQPRSNSHTFRKSSFYSPL
jgi:hypothetical protein